VVLLAHWGEGYAPPSAEQRRLAERAAAAGVDLIIGHHPHLAQPLALVGAARVPVAFSLGNYAFGTPGRPELDVGLLLRATVRAGRIGRLELIPLDVQNRRVGYRPTPLTGFAAAAALGPLVAASRREGAALSIEGDVAVLVVDPAAAPRGAP
jgi:poly-gamma-glutamate capsule biosynthesis protein CapA/YwtB (metallophosphatase superfamily)